MCPLRIVLGAQGSGRRAPDGSRSNTSRPAAAICPLPSAATSAAWSISSPRAVLTSDRVAREQRELARADQPASAVDERRVQRQHVDSGEHRVEVGELDLVFALQNSRSGFGSIASTRQSNPRSRRVTARPIAPSPTTPDGRAGEVAGRAEAAPLAGANDRVELRQPPDAREHQRQRHVGDRLGVDRGRGDDRDAGVGCRGDVDRVRARPPAEDRLQIGQRLEHRARCMARCRRPPPRRRRGRAGSHRPRAPGTGRSARRLRSRGSARAPGRARSAAPSARTTVWTAGIRVSPSAIHHMSTAARPRPRISSGGSPCSTQNRSSPRLTSRARVSSPIAVVTAGRCAPTRLAKRSWDSGSGTEIPSGRTLPPLRHLPQRQEQPVVDPRMMRDRERDGQPVRSPCAPREQLEPEHRPRVHPAHQRVVEHRHPGRLEHDPLHLGAHVRPRRVPAPRSQHVRVSDQLDATAAEDVDLATEQPVDHQEPLVVDVGLERLDGDPLAGRQVANPRHRLATRALSLGRVEQLAEVRVRVDDADHFGAGAGGHRLTSSPGPRSTSGRRPTRG